VSFDVPSSRRRIAKGKHGDIDKQIPNALRCRLFTSCGWLIAANQWWRFSPQLIRQSTRGIVLWPNYGIKQWNYRERFRRCHPGSLL